MSDRIVSRIIGAYRRATRPLAVEPAITPPVWRRVEQGPLAGLTFFLPGGRNAPWAAAIRTGTYEAQMLSALAECAGAGGVLYDVGAHIGFFTCAWIRLGGGRVEAFEPLPSTARVLGATISRNHFAPRVRVHNLALGDANGPGRLMANEADLGAASAAFLEDIGRPDSLIDAPHFSPGLARPVQVRRLDDLVATLNLPPPALLKIDVEGAEAQVLAGAQILLTTARPALLCEVHSIAVAVEMADRLARLGYRQRFVGRNRAQPAYLWTPLEPARDR